MNSILHIITDLQDGGAEAVLFRLCTYDKTCRHHVVSLTDAGKYGPLLAEKNISVTCLAMPRGRLTWSGLRRLWRLIRQKRPDVVQTWMYHSDLVGGLLARLAGIQNIVWGIRHTTLSPDENSASTIRVAHLCAWASRYVPRRIICCAEKARDVHVTLGYDASRMHIVHNGYDLSTFHPNPQAGVDVRKDLGIAPEMPIIGFVARFDPVKDHPTLLKSLTLLKLHGHTPVCLLIGSGLDAENNMLVQLIASLGLTAQIRLLGRRTDVPAVMNAIDLHVLTSSSEAFPNVLAEAMACGTPCVTTDVGDAALIVGDTGWIVPPRDPERLAKTLALALTEIGTPEWQSRKDAVRNRIEVRYTIDRMVKSYHAVWAT